MTTISGLDGGTKVRLSVQKPKAVRMHSYLDVEEFQSTARLYGQTIDWPEWFSSPRIGSEQFFLFVDEGHIDLGEVERAGVSVPTRPKNQKLSEMKAVVPEREFYAFSSRASRGGYNLRYARRGGSRRDRPDDSESDGVPDNEEGELPNDEYDPSNPQGGG